MIDPVQNIVTLVPEIVTPVTKIVTPVPKIVAPVPDKMTSVQNLVTPVPEIVTPGPEKGTPVQNITTPATEIVTPVPTKETTESGSTYSRPVLCYVCSSLFSSDTPDCPSFHPSSPAQQVLCEPDQACLHYQWNTDSDHTEVIRECFSLSILLGSIDNPVVAREECTPVQVESEIIQACVCTTDLCNGIIGDNNETQGKNNFKKIKSSDEKEETKMTIISDVNISTMTRSDIVRSQDEIKTVTSATGIQDLKRQPTEARNKNAAVKTSVESNQRAEQISGPWERVKCHQCGNLFSGR